ncbi:MAG: hypothetical protein U0263_12605 [Polyangiaceae bacterium]
MSSKPADDPPPSTPKSTVRAEDTERDLEPPRASSTRPLEDAAGDVSTTLRNATLLSVDGVADHASERTDHRVEELERRLSQLEARVKVLELSRSDPQAGDKRWLFWVGLLVALLLGWQLRAYFR